LMEHWAISVLTVAMVVFSAPLLLDLTVCVIGNLRSPRKQAGTEKRTIRLAVVVPAHDEEVMIGRTVKSLRASCSSTPIYVVAHNCSDATAAVAAQAGAHALELNNPKLRGKGAALRHGFQAALAGGANAFLVVDADSIVSPNLISATCAQLESGADATQCRYELELPADCALHPLTRLRVLAFRGVNVVRAKGRARLGFSAGLFGNGFSLTAETLDRVPFSADSICEDIEYHINLVCAGLRVRWVDSAYVHAPLAAHGPARATQEARWEGGRLHVATRGIGRLLLATAQGKWRAIEMLAEALSLPLSRAVLTLLLVAALPVHWLHAYALVFAELMLLYVIEAALLGDNPRQDMFALAAAPLHVMWKLAITPMVLRQSRKRAEWARTKREAHQP